METSCGIVLVNLGTVLLLQYPQGHWDLPKGHVEENDESKQHTASRELVEETGIDKFRILEGFEYRTDYSFRRKKSKIFKEVWWFIAETEMLDVKLSQEHRNHIWLEWDHAIEHATHNETKGVLKAAKQFMNSR